MRWLALLWLLASPAFAQAVVVKSGEHDGFTRLVLELPTPVDWQLGRTEDGYALRLAGPPQRFDLSQVYRLIPRDRLSAIWVAPDSGDLRMGIGCACHALPFEFRPGVIVIDLREGGPPEGSSFEEALGGAAQAPLPTRRPARPRSRPAGAYDWRALADVAAPPAATGDSPDLMLMRDSLLKQLSRGAVQGVVDMTETPPPRRKTGADLPNMHIGPTPGFDLSDAGPGSRTGAGSACLTEDALDVGGWGTAAPVAGQMSEVKSGLIGEFDAPDPKAVARAVQFYLFLGFGAEAQQALDVFGAHNEHRAMWQAMAGIMDKGFAVPDPFAGMEVCDTPAALWAVLAQAELSPGMQPNVPAVLRGFSALPPHLRRHLGPSLAERFLTRGETETARAIRDAILRVGADPGPQVRLMQAEIDLAQGKAEEGEAALQSLAAEPGPMAPDALVAWVDTLIAQGKPVDPPTVTALAGLMREHEGSALEPALARAHLLALAASGDFDAAFATLAQAPEAEPLVWARLAQEGADSALLTHAVLGAASARPTVEATTARGLAERLTGLGLGAEALRWLNLPVNDPAAADEDDRILAAEAELRRGDARAVLRLLAGMEGERAEPLRAAAQAQRGQPIEAGQSFAAIGDLAQQVQMARRAAAWPLVAQADDDMWKASAALVLPGPPKPQPGAAAQPGALARGRATVAESVDARRRLADLLGHVAVEGPSD